MPAWQEFCDSSAYSDFTGSRLTWGWTVILITFSLLFKFPHATERDRVGDCKTVVNR